MADYSVSVTDAVQGVAAELNADVILFNEPIDAYLAEILDDLLDAQQSSHENVFFMLATYGGDAHAAYLIARELQLRYKRVIVCIAGDCYSAGTLIVLGAHEVVISRRGRLGPLDAQILKKDELTERLSGLTVSIALDELQQKAAEAVHNIASGLKWQSRGQLSFKTALEIAASMTAQMFGEIYRQIDPIKVGEDARFLQLAEHYGIRLSRATQNLKEGAIYRLSKKYPSHECIIDASEAKELFTNVREPSPNERILLDLLGQKAKNASVELDPQGIIVFPTMAPGGGDQHQNHDKEPKSGNAIPRTTSHTGNSKTNGQSRSEQVPSGTGRKTGQDASPKEID